MRDDQVLVWLKQAQVRSNLTVRPVSLDECTKWALKDGALSHESDHFFHIRGVLAHSNDSGWNGRVQPMIDQPEVGILSFIIRPDSSGNIEWLLHAKTEPGTVNGTQIAPTVQATFSNYLRIHNGKETRFLEYVTSDKNVISNTPHSEQGSRFLWKFNRNAVFILPSQAEILDEADAVFCWHSSQVLRYSLGLSYVVNTDARSVIATTEWYLLAEKNAPLFSASCLQNSYCANADLSCAQLLSKFPNQKKVRWEFLPLDAMNGWQWHDTGLINTTTNEQTVGLFNVSMADREVASWCQPLLMSDQVGDCVLFMRIKNNVAQFWIRVACEIGFGNRREFGPSLQYGTENPERLIALGEAEGAHELISICQSDEGSRFMKSVVRYRVVLLPSADIQNNWNQGVLGTWVTMGTLQKLTKNAATTNNELRTLVSLLLSQQFDDAVASL